MTIFRKKGRYLRPGDRIVGDPIDRSISIGSTNNAAGKYVAHFSDGSVQRFGLDDLVEVSNDAVPASPEFRTAKPITIDRPPPKSERGFRVVSRRQREGLSLDTPGIPLAD